MDYSAIFIPMLTLLISQAIVLDLARFRFPRKKVVLILAIELGVLVIVSSAVLILAGLAMYARWYVLILVIPSYTTYIYTSKYRDGRDMFTIVTTIFISFFISIPAMWFSRFNGSGYWHYNFARIVLASIVFVFIHYVFRKSYLLAQEEIDKGWGVFSILPFLGSVVLYYTFVRYGRRGSFIEVLYATSATMVIMVAVYAVIFYMFQQLHEKYIVLEQQRILAMQNKAQFEQYLLFKETSETMNRRWHDLRHTTQVMIELLESGDTDTALSNLKDQMGMSSYTYEEYCQHPAVNSILCLWAERSRKENILLSIVANVPATLEIESVELSALFANAIENAYYACMELPDDVERYIKVEAHYNGKRLAIGITNTCRDSVRFENDMPISSKEGGGIGTLSMLYTVKRFHGAYTFSAEDGLFSTRFVLNV
ncbi:MAG: GHKL domain-containing protein [Sphaerochaeta sp.]|nr:GHKL domain-containing protein [Sphaerochaeta sp.]